MNNNLKHFYTTQNYSVEELNQILQKATALKTNNKTSLLRKTIFLLFFNPSLRTRASFITGMHELGGEAISLEVGGGIYNLSFDEGEPMLGNAAEHVKEAANVLGRYGKAIAIRKNDLGTTSTKVESSNWEVAKRDEMLNKFMEYSPVPVINMESNLYHPCQALADIMTIKEKQNNVKGKKFLLTWTYHPKPLPTAVPNSAALIASKFGMDVTLLHPKEYDLDNKIMSNIEENIKNNGSSLEITDDIDSAYDGADVVYAKSWGSLNYYGTWDKEIEIRKKYTNWQVTEDKMDKTNNGLFMHCLPVRRNVVVSDQVIDSSNSVIYDQAENRLHAQKGLLTHIIDN
ncbi:MAG: N-acetylornithine carbamoyltransferase [Candidatus Ranarchaeia archaeon]